MANFQAADALSELVNDLKSWVSLPSFQKILNGKKGSQQAMQLYTAVDGLSALPTVSQLEGVIQCTIELNNARKLFRLPHHFFALKIRLISGKHCSKCISEGSITSNKNIYSIKPISIDRPVINEPTFIHRTGTHTNDIVYIDLNQFNPDRFDKLLTESVTTLPFQLVKALHQFQKYSKSIFAFIDEDLPFTTNRIEAYLRALSLNIGKAFHEQVKYTGTSLIRDHSSPSLEQPLEQFIDVQQVLSECFMEDDLLNRFLRLYQVLENFMVRKQIINVQRTTVSRTFSIRDFRRLYGETQTGEQNTLVNLLQSTLEISHLTNGQQLSGIIKDRWDNKIVASPTKHNLETELLMIYGPTTKKATDFNAQKFSEQLGNPGDRHNSLGQLVYRFRNMIVHNKETEFHLTHSSMSKDIKLVMNDFLLPSIDDIIFSLLNVDKTIVWYPHPTISLYKS